MIFSQDGQTPNLSKRIIQKNQKRFLGLYRQALLAFYTGDSSRAERLLQRVLGLNPTFGSGQLLYGKIALDAYSKTEAYSWYLIASHSLEISSQQEVGQDEAMLDYAYLNNLVGNQPQALKILRMVLEKNPDSFWALQLLPHPLGTVEGMGKYTEKYLEFDRKRKEISGSLVDHVLR